MPCQVYHHGDVQELEELKNILYSYKTTEKELHNIIYYMMYNYYTCPEGVVEVTPTPSPSLMKLILFLLTLPSLIFLEGSK